MMTTPFLTTTTRAPRSGRRCGLSPVRMAVAATALVLLSGAAPFAFAPAPQLDLNRIYRVNVATGEVGACQYGLKEGTIGVTFCFPAGEGAGPQALGEYGLVSSSHTRESGVFRVNHRTGEISSCYVFNTHVVCTPQVSATDTASSAPADAAQQQNSATGDASAPPTPAQ
ncbi:hypothetical protein FHS81_000010 [Pseudochelatococcus contaminans]|uniref:Uncharacterized protein n=2 Tax=Pseudochelatococcus contaminans TaxID=1538103 RepID=A0A7W5Z0W5_9HYPH|nr:hypothetical protein [Pseudochelatococcus contaminans]